MLKSKDISFWENCIDLKGIVFEKDSECMLGKLDQTKLNQNIIDLNDQHKVLHVSNENISLKLIYFILHEIRDHEHKTNRFMSSSKNSTQILDQS